MFTISSTSFTVDVDFDSLNEKHPGIVTELAKHGLKQLLGDNGAGEDDKQKAADEKLARIIANGFEYGAGGGGGKALTPFESECRNVVADILANAGMKKADAKKAAMKPEEAIRKVSKSDEIFQANWAKVTAKVNAVLAARKKNAVDVEVTL